MGQLAPILQEYFTAYVVTQRAMSGATIRAYRDTWKLFLTFLSQAGHGPAHQLQLTHTTPAHVVAFLDYLEQEHGNSAATRTLRPAAIKSVRAFHASRSPEHLDTLAPINAIPAKKTPKPQMTFLTSLEAQALLDTFPPTPEPTAKTRRCSPWRSKPGFGSVRSPACRSPAPTPVPPRTWPAPARAARTALRPDPRHRHPAQALPPRTGHPPRPGTIPSAPGRRVVRRRRSAPTGNPPDTRYGISSRARRQAHHRPHPASHRHDALPQSRRRHRRHRTMARPRIHRHHEHLPARRHEPQTDRPRPGPASPMPRPATTTPAIP